MHQEKLDLDAHVHHFHIEISSAEVPISLAAADAATYDQSRVHLLHLRGRH
jgi:hypothetical protein